MKKYEMTSICRQFDLKEESVQRWIRGHLIEPMDPSGPYFDEEDLRRIQLILEMQEICNANDDSLEVILHLVDQVHVLNSELARLQK
jgi:hypothetical protein